MMKIALSVTIPLLTLLACSTPGHPAKADPTVTDHQITARVTDDIWPAVSAYNQARTQTSAGAKALLAVTDPALRADGAAEAFNALRSAAAKLGRQSEYDPTTGATHSNDGLTLARADLSAANDTTATVTVCYTYTDTSYVDIQNPQEAPSASQTTLDLMNVDNVWYLHAITDDHIVPGCSR